MIVTLLTDFGTRDGYVGAMKGVMLRICPGCQLVDITHEVPPGDVPSASFLLRHHYPFFPPGTVHLAVVDPGVGTARRAVALEAADGHRFVGPDNGLFGFLEESGGLRRAVQLANPRYFLPRVSATFHGRDVFAPVAAHLCAGVDLAELGPPVSGLVRSEVPRARPEGEGVVGEVIYVDRFGNLITNLLPEHLRGAVEVTIEGRPVRLVGAYQEGRPGEVIGLIGSFGSLEIALREANAAQLLGMGRGSRVVVRRR